jgi:hypothetical protein
MNLNINNGAAAITTLSTVACKASSPPPASYQVIAIPLAAETSKHNEKG